MQRAVSLAFAVAALLACGPLGPVPGGALSGTPARELPRDWSFTDAYDVIQLETRPEDPYSVNLWGVAVAGDFYLASGSGENARWVRHILADPRVRLRVGDTLYELRAARVEDPAQLDAFLRALQRKYDWEPSTDERDGARVFRLLPRAEG